MKTMASKKLFMEFPPVSGAEWQAAMMRDLKTAAAEKKLAWQSDEGLTIRPYYRAEDVSDLNGTDAAPGSFPYRRGTKASGDWLIREEIDAKDAAEANHLARAAVDAGAENIAFNHIAIAGAGDIERLLSGLDEIPVHFAAAEERLIARLLQRQCELPDPQELSTGCEALASLGFAAGVIRDAPDGFIPFTIHAEAWAEAGATAVEEIGFALAAGVEFLAAAAERGADASRTARSVQFEFATGPNYFFEIAKLRAFRGVWARAAESFGCTREAAKARIAARTARWNTGIYDAHVNILRAATEAMAAILGGADAVTVTPFDHCLKAPDEASRRLARNTQLLLKREAMMGQLADAGGGSYALETITDFLAAEGWRILKEIEAQCGYRKAHEGGVMAQKLEARRTIRDRAVATRRRVLVGTNWYANAEERLVHCRERHNGEPHLAADARAARPYEQLRQRMEQYTAAGHEMPRILLAEIGDARMRAARSGFAAIFFACGGFETTIRRFKRAEEIAQADVDLIVLCSADAEYANLTAQLMARMKTRGVSTPVIVAGKPECAEALREAGVADFVHARSEPLEFLARWQKRLKIQAPTDGEPPAVDDHEAAARS